MSNVRSCSTTEASELELGLVQRARLLELILTDIYGPQRLLKEGHLPPEEHGDVLPEDMSTTSLVGGGLIAGEALFALALGIAGLVALVK